MAYINGKEILFSPHIVRVAPTLQAKEVIPGATEQSIRADNGYDGLEEVLVRGDSNLVAENIAEGVSIFGVEGTHSGGGVVPVGSIDSIIDKSITEVTSGVTSIGDYAFYNCSKLTSANFPNATNVGLYAFFNCYKLTSVNIPNAFNFGDYAFYNCSKLTSANIPNARTISTSMFRGCSKLTGVDLHNATSISMESFSGCYLLKSVILRSETMCKLSSSNAFNYCYHILGTVNATNNPNGDKDGYIYVPRALVDSYKSATNWSTYASQIRALEDYTVDGTITGALDESKI